MKAREKLTPSQQRFIEYLLIDPCSATAYQQAFPRCKAKHARTAASRMLAKPAVKEELKAARLAMQRRTNITADRVLEEVARLAFSDVSELVDVDGSLKAPRDLPMETRRAIASTRVKQVKIVTDTNGRRTFTSTEEVIEYRLFTKIGALQVLLRYLGLDRAVPGLSELFSHLPGELVAEVQAAMRPEPE
jgi:phage terminase small subunit